MTPSSDEVLIKAFSCEGPKWFLRLFLLFTRVFDGCQLSSLPKTRFPVAASGRAGDPVMVDRAQLIAICCMLSLFATGNETVGVSLSHARVEM